MRDSNGRFTKGDQTNKRYNRYNLDGAYGIGYTSSGEEFYFDLDDYDKIKDYCWSVTTRKDNNYKFLNARDCANNKTIRIHNLIMGTNNIDHINKNTLDNRKANLRATTQRNNSFNQSQPYNSKCLFMGVSCVDGKYHARIGYNHKKIHLGSFATLEEAIKARLEAECKYFGVYAPHYGMFATYGLEVSNEQ